MVGSTVVNLLFLFYPSLLSLSFFFSPASRAFLSFIQFCYIPDASIKMFSSTIIALLSAGFAIAAPIYHRDVTLDPAAVAEAQVRENAATRAFSAAQIQVHLFVCFLDPSTDVLRCLCRLQVGNVLRLTLLPVTSAKILYRFKSLHAMEVTLSNGISSPPAYTITNQGLPWS